MFFFPFFVGIKNAILPFPFFVAQLSHHFPLVHQPIARTTQRNRSKAKREPWSGQWQKCRIIREYFRRVLGVETSDSSYLDLSCSNGLMLLTHALLRNTIPGFMLREREGGSSWPLDVLVWRNMDRKNLIIFGDFRKGGRSNSDGVRSIVQIDVPTTPFPLLVPSVAGPWIVPQWS
jgi:hypothetical protein